MARRRGLRRMRREPKTAEKRTDALPSPRLVRQATRTKRLARTDNVKGRQAAGRQDGNEESPASKARKIPERSLHGRLSALAVLVDRRSPGPPSRTGTSPDEVQDLRRRSSSRYQRRCPDGESSSRGLHVSGDGAAVTLRAATGLDLRVRAFGGPERPRPALLGIGEAGRRAKADRLLAPAERSRAPSFTFSWEDELGQAGAVTVRGGADSRIRFPAVEGELCDLRESQVPRLDA